MPQPRLLASSLLASSLVASALVLPAIGQSRPATTPAPLAAAITSPTLFALDTTPAPTTSPLSIPPGAFTLKPSMDTLKFDSIYVGKPFKISKDAADDRKLHQVNPADRAKAEAGLNALLQRDRLHPALLAQTQTACATLRSYNFTARDLKSPHPHASSETDCTPITSAHLRELNLPMKQPAAIVSTTIQGTTIQGTTTFATPK